MKEKEEEKSTRIFLKIVYSSLFLSRSQKIFKIKIHEFMIITSIKLCNFRWKIERIKNIRRRKRVGNGLFLSSSPSSGSRKGQRKNNILT